MATYVPDATNASEPVGTRPISTAAPEFRALKQRVNQLTTGMGKNKIINGKMEIAQRGTSFAAVAAGTYTLDRWRFSINATSAVITVSQQSDAPSSKEFQNSLRLTVTPTADTSIGSTDQVNIQQRIEGYNVRDLIGRTFTLSFEVRSSKTGTHCVYFQNDAQDRSYVAEYTVNAADTWEKKSITVSGGLITAGTWNWTTGIGLIVGWTLAAGSNLQTTANAWQTGGFLATANQVNCLDAANNIFAITGAQLEVGGVATPFEHRPFGAELALCQRYFYKSYELGVIPGAIASSGALWTAAQATSNYLSIPRSFPVTMRATPTVVIYSTLNGATGFINVDGVNLAATSILEGQSGTTVRVNNVATNVNQFANCQITASIEL